MGVAGLHGFEQGGAQRRRERQRHEGRDQNRDHHHRRKLPVDVTDRAFEKSQGHKHRDQHHGHANDGARDLAHGFARGSQRRQAFFVHDALDVLHHHNCIVHHNADHQHHGKHGQHIDRVAQRIQAGKSAHQGDGHHQRGDDGVADVLQEQEHHQEHQKHRFEQGFHHLLDGDFHEFGAVVGNRGFHARWEVLGQFVQPLANGFGRGQRVAGGRELHANAAGRVAVQTRLRAVALCAQLDAGHVFESHRRAIQVGAQDDVAKFLGGAQLALDHHGGKNGLTGQVGQVANRAGGHLRVLRGDGG